MTPADLAQWGGFLVAIGSLLTVIFGRKKVSAEARQLDVAAKVSLEEMVNERMKFLLEKLTDDIGRLSTELKVTEGELKKCQDQHTDELRSRATLAGKVGYLEGQLAGLNVVPIKAVLPVTPTGTATN